MVDGLLLRMAEGGAAGEGWPVTQHSRMWLISKYIRTVNNYFHY